MLSISSFPFIFFFFFILKHSIIFPNRDDIERAISKLKTFGSYRILKIGKKKLIQSIPTELSTDHTTILELAQNNNAWVDKTMIRNKLNWEEHRIDNVLQHLMTDGMIWVDDLEKERHYWFPSLIEGIVL